jgi:hypothetical protein
LKNRAYILLTLFIVLVQLVQSKTVPKSIQNSISTPYNYVDSTDKKNGTPTSILGLKKTISESDTSKSSFTNPISDSNQVASSTKIDTSISPFASSDLNDPINYQSEDSIIYDVKNKMIYIYGNGSIKFQNTEVVGAKISYDWEKNNITAESMKDSIGNEYGKPVMKDGDKSYDATKFSYSFKTKKGKVYEVVTEEGGAIVHLQEGKRTNDSSWFGKKAWFTTCEDREHPHFYIQANKAKIVPNKLVVTGPANLVISSIPTPLYLPFGIFPLQKGRRSGIIMPQYGDSRNLGFFLKGGGYYFAIKEKVGLSFTGDIYSRGSWGLGTAINYAVRYKFKGNLAFNYFRLRPENPENKANKASNSYIVSWRHNQESQSRPNSIFNASVNFQTSNYNRNNQVANPQLLNAVLNSNISYTKSWRNLPFQLGISAGHNQNLRTQYIHIDLPILSFNVARINPFKRKIQSGKTKWYENIGFTYNLDAKSTITTFDSILLDRSSLDRIQYGMQQNFRLDAPITLFKYIRINPNFNYTGRFYFKEVDKYWDPTYMYDTILSAKNEITRIDTTKGKIITDTFNKFRYVQDFNLGVSMSTKLVGIFKFKSEKIKAMRHVFTPTVGFEYHPDFGNARWNYWDQVQRNEAGEMQKFSRFEANNELYGSPGDGLQGAITYGINNEFQLKTYSRKDTVNHENKIQLLDNFSINGSYNFAADSLKLNPFNIRANSRAIPHIDINFSMQLDPYAIDSNGRRYNTFLWNEQKKLLRITNTNVSIGGTLQSKKRINTGNGTENTTDEERRMIQDNMNYYYDFTIPWTARIGYNFNLRNTVQRGRDTTIITQAINTDFDFNVTPKWKVNIVTGFDINKLKPTLTTLAIVRDLHCWELSFNWTAYPVEYQTYMITIRVKNPLLQDLKLTKRRNYIDQQF